MANDKVKQVEIGDNTFYVRRMDPFTAMETFADLQKHFAAPLASLVEARSATNDEDAMQVIMSGIEKLSSQLDSTALRNVYTLLLFKPESITFSVQGSAPQKLTATNRGMAFNSMGDIVELIIEVVRHNYADFLSQMLDRFGSVGLPKAS